jgi:hypothetical protein
VKAVWVSGALVLIASLAIGDISTNTVWNPLDPAQLADAPLRDHSAAPANYTPQEWVLVKPHLNIMACIFTQHLVRHHLSPAKVGFDPCAGTPFKIKFSDDLALVTVSGSAMADGQSVQFRADLQHFPRAQGLGGFETFRVSFLPSH